MKHAYVALYGQLGHLRPAWGTEASAPLDAWTSAQVLDLELAGLAGPHRPARQRDGVAGEQAERQWLVDRAAVPQGQRRRAGDRAGAARDARLRGRVHGEHAERLRLAGAHLRAGLDGRAGEPTTTGHREPALRHGVRGPGPAARAPEHPRLDGRARRARGAAGAPHGRRRLGLQPARLIGRHVHLRGAARLRRGARPVGVLLRGPRPRAGHRLAAGAATGGRLLAGLAGRRAQSRGDGVRPARARRPRRDRLDRAAPEPAQPAGPPARRALDPRRRRRWKLGDRDRRRVPGGAGLRRPRREDGAQGAAARRERGALPQRDRRRPR